MPQNIRLKRRQQRTIQTNKNHSNNKQTRTNKQTKKQTKTQKQTHKETKKHKKKHTNTQRNNKKIRLKEPNKENIQELSLFRHNSRWPLSSPSQMGFFFPSRIARLAGALVSPPPAKNPAGFPPREAAGAVGIPGNPGDADFLSKLRIDPKRKLR